MLAARRRMELRWFWVRDEVGRVQALVVGKRFENFSLVSSFFQRERGERERKLIFSTS